MEYDSFFFPKDDLADQSKRTDELKWVDPLFAGRRRTAAPAAFDSPHHGMKRGKRQDARPRQAG
jgi:hypothetical protein